MGEHADVSGELVVRNGKQRGTRLPFAVPVTVIGAADFCDVVLTARGVGDVHCLVTLTPAGPVVRSWFPDATLVNGTPTAAAVLADGDELLVGPCLFQVAWHADALVPLELSEPSEPGEDLVALRTQAAAVAAQQAALVEEEWHLREREDALSEQETQLAAVLDERHRHLAGLLHALGDGREVHRAEAAKLAADRDRVAKMRANVAPLHTAAKRDRRKARKLLAAARDRIARTAAADRQAIAAERLGLDRETRVLVDRVAEFAAERARTAAEFADTQRRLDAAWELLADGQRKLVADRTEAADFAAEQRAALDRRDAELTARERALDAGQTRVEARVQELLAEAARLETRTAHARAALEVVEQKRARLEAADAPVAALPDAVPLDRKSDKSAGQLLAELQTRERDLSREKRQIAAAAADLTRREAALADERLVVAEQAAAIGVAQDLWRASEFRTLADLEAVARAVHARDMYQDARERELAAAAHRCRQRERDLWEARVKLDGWQAALAAQELRSAAERDRAAADLDATRDHLTRWEAALGGLCRKWAAARKRDRDAVRSELAAAAAARSRFDTKLADLDRDRLQLLADAAAVAAQSVAVEQLTGELTTREGGDARQAARRLRVLRKQWDRRYTQFARDLETRRESAAAAGAAAAAKAADWHRVLTDALTRRDVLATEELAAAADHLSKARHLDERSAALTAESARRSRTDRELVQLRAEMDRLTAAVMSTAEPRLLSADPDVLPLRPVLSAA